MQSFSNEANQASKRALHLVPVSSELEELFSATEAALKCKRLSDLLITNGKAELSSRQPIELAVTDSESGEHVELIVRDLANTKLTTVIDVTDSLEIQQLSRQFVAMVSHDLRTPLSSVQMSIDMISEGMFGELSEAGKEQLLRAERSIDRMTLLINDLLDIERMEGGSFSVNPQILQFDDIIEHALEATAFRAKENGVNLTYKGKPEKCFADSARLMQVLTNLIDNAIKFSSAGQSVEISSHSLKNFLEIRVSDKGRGIPEEMQEHIFERFVQVNQQDRLKRNGSGLGLAICKAIILNHRGKIGVKSKPGAGSTFWFRLPREKPNDSSAAWSRVAPRRSSKKSISTGTKTDTTQSELNHCVPLECQDLKTAIAKSASFSIAPSHELPVPRFQECLIKAALAMSITNLVNETDSFGQLELREQLQQLLLRRRGIDCSPEQIIVFHTTEGGLDLLCRLTLDNERVVATEDPCFPGIGKHLAMNGIKVCPIPLDAEGLSVKNLAALAKKPSLVYVTPAHQDTTGLIMSNSRRLSLLNWASTEGALIVEDDYGCEFIYEQETSPAIFAQDISGCVVYKYNFWKALYPLVRISFMIIPKRMIPQFRNTLNSIRQDIPYLEQLALAIMIKEGHYEKYLETQQEIYAKRRRALLSAIERHAGEQIDSFQGRGGTDLTVIFHPNLHAQVIETKAAECGIKLLATKSSYSTSAPPLNEYLISFSNVDEEKIERQIASFFRSLSVKP
jgi:DNA-binding transcriptional MocR family regulator/signal transduction histidine kinase